MDIDLHKRRCAGDTEAVETLAAWWQWLFQQLCRAFPHVNQHLIADGVSDALREYLERPDCFDPARGSLEAFLYRVSWRKVRALYRSEFRCQRREQPYPEDILNQLLESQVNGEGEAEVAENEARWQARFEQFERFLDGLDEGDRQVMVLWYHGERRAAVFARVMEIEHLPPEDQRVVVSQTKGRLRKAAQRQLRNQMNPIESGS